MQTTKDLVLSALEGRPVHRMPVSVPYVCLYHIDHFTELTGLPLWKRLEWLYSEPTQYLELLKIMVSKAPFDLLWALHSARPRSERQDVEFVHKNGTVYIHYKKENVWKQADTVDFYESWNTINETQKVFDLKDLREKIRPVSAEQMRQTGQNDYLDITVQHFGKDLFIVSGTLVGMIYESHLHLGLSNLLMMLVENPHFVDELCKRLLECKIEDIRRIASSGGDAIAIDDALATCDMISVKHYQRFCLPYLQQMVQEIHRLGFKAILIYFGGIADRLEHIADTGADGLIMETTMKNYVNDIDQIAEKIGKRITLFGNIDPVRIMQDGTDQELYAEMQRQAAAGRKARGFIMSTGSPITPQTPLSRVLQFIEWAKKM